MSSEDEIPRLSTTASNEIICPLNMVSNIFVYIIKANVLFNYWISDETVYRKMKNINSKNGIVKY